MRIDGRVSRSIWLYEDQWSVGLFDQTRLPHGIEEIRLTTLEEAALAIENMQTRGAPMIAACASYGIALAMRQDPSTTGLQQAYERLLKTRPTAVNLRWALDAMREHLLPFAPSERVMQAYQKAENLCNEEVERCRTIGEHGFSLLKDMWQKKQATLNILTHCNAGWLACVDWGTALAPLYLAHERGIPIHVWVDETRPRVQGALTAFELSAHGLSCTVITDNAGGLLMQQGRVDAVFVGADRVTRQGDVANKIGTYLKALAARANQIPFYVMLPSSTLDWTVRDGLLQIPIEERSEEEISHICGISEQGNLSRVRLFPKNTSFFNPGFDITPASLVTALITERGICAAREEGLLSLYGENLQHAQAS